MRILVLTLMLSFVSQGVFGAAEGAFAAGEGGGLNIFGDTSQSLDVQFKSQERKTGNMQTIFHRREKAVSKISEILDFGMVFS